MRHNWRVFLYQASSHHLREFGMNETVNMNDSDRPRRRVVRWRLARLGFICAVLLFCFNAVAHCQQRQEIRRSYDLQPGAIVALENVSGDITISSWGESRAEMVAVKSGPAEQLDQVDVSIDAQPARLAIKTVYPHRSDNKVSVSFNLRVPNNVNLDSIRSVSGDVQISDIQGRVVAHSVSGDMKIRGAGQDLDLDSVSGDATVSNVGGRASIHSVSGDVEVNDVNGDLDTKAVSGDLTIRRVRGHVNADTVSGDVQISESDPTSIKASTISGDIQFSGDLNPGGRYELKSHSGTIKVILPAGSSFAVQGSTFSGKVVTDFEIRTQGAIERNKVAGVVGQGGPTLDLRSFSGSILVRKSGSK